jgi:hypothetical protein
MAYTKRSRVQLSNLNVELRVENHVALRHMAVSAGTTMGAILDHLIQRAIFRHQKRLSAAAATC